VLVVRLKVNSIAVADKTALLMWQPHSASRLSNGWMLSMTLQTLQHAAIVLACVAPSIAGKACTYRQSSLNPTGGANTLRALSGISFPA